MPTTAITPQDYPSAWATSATSITWTAADVANGNHVSTTALGNGPWLLLARNVHATTTYTVSVTSVALTTYGSTGDVAATNITAGAQAIIQLTADGWKNSSDQIAFSGNNSSIQFAFFSF